MSLVVSSFPYPDLGVLSKKAKMTYTIGASYTGCCCDRLARLHRMMAQTKPLDGQERDILGLSLHRIVVTFIRFTICYISERRIRDNVIRLDI